LKPIHNAYEHSCANNDIKNPGFIGETVKHEQHGEIGDEYTENDDESQNGTVFAIWSCPTLRYPFMFVSLL
jgi:hypothetical protein